MISKSEYFIKSYDPILYGMFIFALERRYMKWEH